MKAKKPANNGGSRKTARRDFSGAMHSIHSAYRATAEGDMRHIRRSLEMAMLKLRMPVPKLDLDIHVRPTPPRPVEVSDLMKRLPEIGMEDRSTPLVADSYARERGRPIVPISGGDVLPTVSGFLPNSGAPAITLETVKKHADSGNRFEAVKSYRLLKGTGLGPAYKAVNAYLEGKPLV